MNTASLGFGALMCPGRQTVPAPPLVMHEAFRCQNCGAYVNLHSSLSPTTGYWSCTFCNKSNSSNREYKDSSNDDLHNWPELVTSVVDYVDSGILYSGPVILIVGALVYFSSEKGILKGVQPHVSSSSFLKLVFLYFTSCLSRVLFISLKTVLRPDAHYL